MNLRSRSASSKFFASHLAAAMSLKQLRGLVLLAAILPLCLAAMAQSAHYGGLTGTVSSGAKIPMGVAMDGNGNLFVVDNQMGTVQEVQAVNGVLPAGATGFLVASGFRYPYGIALDANGDLFVADMGNQAIKEIVAINGEVSSSSSVQTVYSNASSWPSGVAVDSNGNVFFTDEGAPYAVYEIVAVNGQVSSSSTVKTLFNGSFTSAWGIGVDTQNDVFVADHNISTNSVSEIVAVGGAVSSGSQLNTVVSGIGGPISVALDANGNLFVGEDGANDLIELAAGSWDKSSTPSFRVVQSGFDDPYFLAVGLHGEIYVADTYNYEVKTIMVDPPNFGKVTVGQTRSVNLPFTFDSETTLGSTFASVLGQGVSGHEFVYQAQSGDSYCQANLTYYTGQSCLIAVQFSPQHPGLRLGSAELLDSDGNILASVALQGTGVAAQLSYLTFTAPTNLYSQINGQPTGVAVDSQGDVFYSDADQGAIFELVGGSGSPVAIAGSFGCPDALALDGAGDLFVADYCRNNIYEIQADSNGSLSGNSNVILVAGGFSEPWGVAVDGAGNVFVTVANSSSTTGGAVFEVQADSTGHVSNYSNWVQIATGFNEPMGLARDAKGDLFLADTHNLVVKEIVAVNGQVSASSQVVTVGSGFLFPTSIAVDAAGNVYVTDDDSGTNSMVKVILATNGAVSATSKVLTLTNGLIQPWGITVDSIGNLFFTNQTYASVQELPFGTAPAQITFKTATPTGMLDATDDPQTLTLANIGNALLSFPLTATGTNPSLSSGFLWDSASTCQQTTSGSAVFTLAPGASCQIAIDFQPAAAGAISGSMTMTDDSLSSAAAGYATQQISMTGNGIVPQTFTITFTAGDGGTVYGPTTQNVTQGGSTVPVYAYVNRMGWNFQYWQDANGNVVSSDNPIVIQNAGSSQNLTAVFAAAYMYSGSCGPAAGHFVATAPGGEDLCANAETASAVTSDGTSWKWSCNGWNGGATAMCTAPIQPPCDPSIPCITTVAGGGPNQLPALASPLNYPDGAAGDSQGNIYITDQGANRVYKVDPSGTLTVFAGNGESNAAGGDEGPAALGQVGGTGSVVTDAAGNVYFGDSGDVVRKVTPDGIIHTIAGVRGWAGYGGDDIPATQTVFSAFGGLAIDQYGDLFISANNAVREVTPDGIAHLVAGIPGVAGFAGDGGPATQALFMDPQGIAVDKSGNIFVADMYSQRIRMFTVGGNISTVAGNQSPNSNGQYGGAFAGDGGPATQALLSYPTAVAVDAQGNIYIDDYFNGRVRVFTLGGNISTAVGNGWGYNGDGPATSVSLTPLGLNFDKDGNLLIADQYNFLVRRYNPSTGMVQTVAGNGLQGMGGDGYSALSAILTNSGLDQNGTICENLDCPRVALDSNSNLYIADTLNNAIRRVDAVTKTITTIAGSSRAAGGYQGDNNLATGALLNRPEGLVFDSNGNLFFADAQNNVIREMDTGNLIHTIAGNQALGCGYSDNADATQGQLCGPIGLTIDYAGNLYVADSGNCLVRRIAAPDANGLRALSTIAGSYVVNACTNPWTNSGNLTNTVDGDNGPATSATLAYPMGVAIHADGSLLIADTFNNAIRRVDLQSGIITTLSTPGNWVSVPTDVAADGHGDIFFTLTNTTFVQWNGTVYAQIGELSGNGTTTLAGGANSWLPPWTSISYGNGFSGDNGPAVDAMLDTPSGLALNAAGDLYFYDAMVGRVRKINSVGQGGLPLSPQPIVNGIVTAYGKPLASVTITYHADTSTYQSGTTATDGNGNYSIAVTAGWSGTITPALTGYNFTPSNNWIPAVTTSATQNFTAVITPPDVVTASTVGSASATIASGGTVADEGGASVTARGVCFGTAANPAITGSCTSDGAGAGIFTSTLTGLELNTTYHARAFATSAAGTFYGSDVQFTTMNPSTSSAAGAYAYVTGFDTNTVSVIDTASQRVLSTVDLNPVGPTWYGDICPEGVANSSTSGKIYVASLCLSTISAINSSTLGVADYITVPNIAGGGTRAAVTSLDGSHIYLSDGYENEDSAGYIRVINTANDTFSSFYIGKDTYDLKLHPDGNRLYATNDHDGTVTAVDLTNNTVIATIGTGRSPYGMVINNAGTRAYVANYGDNTVSVIDVASGSPTLNTVLQTISVGNLDSPTDVAVSADGSRLYVSNSNNVTVSVFNTAGDANTPFGTISLSHLTNPWPWGLAMQPGSANLWVLLPYASEAVIVDTAGDANTIVNTIAVSGVPEQLGSFFSTVAAATVSQHTPIINWATPAAITYGTALDSTQLNATASYNGSTVAGTLTYTPAAGTVLNAGANQTLSVTFTPTDIADYTTATGSVSLTVSQATPTVTWATPAAITWATALSATQLDATANVQGTFAYTPQLGAYVNAGHQTLLVTFTPNDTTNYAVVTARVPLTVNQATPTITWATPAAITYGTALGSAQLNATDSFNGATIPGTFAYTPASGTVLNAGANQTLSVTFTPTDATDFTTANKSVSLTVNKATPTITWATPVAITYGTALSATQLNATASVPGTFAYLPVSGTVLGAGSQTITATFTPTDTANYTTATATVTLTVNLPPVIALQPTNQTVTLGNTATFTVAATGTPTLTYDWQYFQAGAWHNWGVGTGFKTATFTTLATTANYNGLQFRVVVTDGNGLTATSNTVTLTVNSPPVIALQPTNQTVTLGNTATFTVAATGTPTLTYDWQYFQAGAWHNWGVGTGFKTATFTTLATTANYNGVQFRVVVTDGNGLTATSNTVTLTVNSPPVIALQPTNQTVTLGNTATFTVTATGTPTLTYAWQYFQAGAWHNWGVGTGFKTATFTTLATNANYNGLQFRVIVTDGNGLTATSNTVTLTVNSPPVIVLQPTNQTVTLGNTATFTVAATGTPTLTYDWQYFQAGAWHNWGVGTGFKTATFTTLATNANYNGLQFRVVVTDGNGLTAISSLATLTVQ